MCVRARARVSVCVCVCARACVCVCERERERERVCNAFFFVFFFCIVLYVNCFGRTMLYMCIEYHVSAQGVDERMINVHYYYQRRSE